MLVPRIWRGEFFDDFGDFPFNSLTHYNNANTMMKTDVKETNNGYELTIDMPGIKKGDISAELKDGYLTISVKSNYSNDDKDDEGRYIRRERHYGSCSRSFYVGDSITQDEIKAGFNNGILKLTVPKKDEHKQSEDHNYIKIN